VKRISSLSGVLGRASLRVTTGGIILGIYPDFCQVHKCGDNLPDPVTAGNPYIPVNSPAIGDLFDLFNFGNHGHDH
jgi:hypothetical protein